MALRSITLTGNSWTAITTAGESGACFTRDISTDEGNNTVYITHSGITPAVDTANFLTLFPSIHNEGYLHFSADDLNDVYYARCAGSSGTATILVDSL